MKNIFNKATRTSTRNVSTRIGIDHIRSAELDMRVRNAKDIGAFLKENAPYLQKKTLYEHLNMLLMQKNLRVSDVVEPSGIEKPYVYQIFSGKKKPSRDKLIAIAFGMGLSVDETDTLLKVAHYKELYVKDKRDLIIKFCILQGFDINGTNELLYTYNLADVGHLK